jgi:hypothetical protein
MIESLLSERMSSRRFCTISTRRGNDKKRPNSPQSRTRVAECNERCKQIT